MLINWFRGDMKFVGVRPLSKHYFELYKEEVRQRRIKYKPGLIPPFYADMPEDLESIQASEMKYLDLYDKRPLITDCKYFWKSAWNILFRHARSKVRTGAGCGVRDAGCGVRGRRLRSQSARSATRNNISIFL